MHPVSLPHTIVPKHSDNSAVLPLKSVERAVVIQIPPGQPGPPVQRAVEQEPKHERIAVMVKPKLKHVILKPVVYYQINVFQMATVITLKLVPV